MCIIHMEYKLPFNDLRLHCIKIDEKFSVFFGCFDCSTYCNERFLFIFQVAVMVHFYVEKRPHLKEA